MSEKQISFRKRITVVSEKGEESVMQVLRHGGQRCIAAMYAGVRQALVVASLRQTTTV